MSRQVILDTETTGLSADAGDRIVEIGCVELISRKLTGNNLHFYLNPERDSHEEALKVHGLTTEFLSDKPKFAAIAQELRGYLADADVIIHNAPFDVGFLNKEFERVGIAPLAQWVACVTDTLVMAKQMFPGKRNSLDALCDRLDVDNSGRALHGALLDAELLADVYINLTRGQEALLVEDGAPEAALHVVEAVNLRAFDLPVLAPSAAERAEHDQCLLQLDKSSGGKTVWRRMEAAVG